MPNPFLVDDPSSPPQSQSANPFLTDTGWTAGDYAKDIERSAEAGNMLGVHQVVGAPGDIASMTDTGKNWLITKLFEKIGLLSPEQGELMRNPLPGTDYQKSRQMGLPKSSDLDRAVESATGSKIYEPQSVPGEYAHTAAQFAPGMVFGAGTPAQRAMQVFVPAAVSETAGQIARRTLPAGSEPYLRAGGALLGAGGVALGQMNRTPEAVLSKALTGATPEDIQKAGRLMQTAKELTPEGGVPLSWDEAIQKVTDNSTRLTGLRRTVENSAGGAGVFNPLMAQRPGQIEAAGGAMIDAITPNPLDPIKTGLRAQSAAEQTIGDTQASINAATRPYYDAGKDLRLDPTLFHSLVTDPIFANALTDIRTNPALNRGVNFKPGSDTVGVVDLAQRRLREMADNARMPGQANTSNLAAANLDSARTKAIAAAEEATGGPKGSYATARLGQSMLRDQFLAPLTEGPVGAVAKTGDVLKQGRAILPDGKVPLDRSPIVADTITQLVARDPQAAENILRHHLGSVFAETASNLQSGPNQMGGVNFANAVRGNSEQAQALQAFTRALPNGNAKWEGMDRFLEVMEATGRRPNIGSPTAFVQADQQALRNGGMLQEVAKAVPQLGSTVLRRLKDFSDQFNTGRNTAQIARILTDPASGAVLERLAKEPQGSVGAANLAFRLTYMGRSGARGAQSGPQSQD